MKFDLDALIRDNIRRMKPYSSARTEYTGDAAGTLFLDANEQPMALEGMPEGVNRYPRHLQEKLKQRLAALKGVSEEQIFLGNGSDEAIDVILRCFARPGQDEIMVFPPTFGMYAVSASVNDLGVNRVPLDDHFRIDVERTLAAAGPSTRAMFICSPNNPTGNIQEREIITGLVERFNGLVVIDEAYVDFSPGGSMLPLLDSYPNLVVLQTFSKAWGLAGARIGMAYASKEIIAVMNKVRFPYNLSMPNTRLAIEALSSYAEYRLSVAESLGNRKWLETVLPEMPCVEKVYPSDANFLLVKTTDGDAIYGYLRDHGIVVRNRGSEPGCAGCLRITVGTAAENRRLLETWKGYGHIDTTETGSIEPYEAVAVSSATNASAAEKKSAAAMQSHPTKKEDGNEMSGETLSGEHIAGSAMATPGKEDRMAVVRRTTSETDITVRLNLDGKGMANIETGVGFYDHMLHQIARHGLFDLGLHATGDLHVDPHHTIEDTAITLGQAFRKALGDKAGIERYGFALPMDEASARVLIDFGGRIYLKWKVRFEAPTIGEVPSSLFEHFFRSFAEAAAANIHVKAKGKDDHHKIEAVFKAFARALRMAVDRNEKGILPSTKGAL